MAGRIFLYAPYQNTSLEIVHQYVYRKFEIVMLNNINLTPNLYAALIFPVENQNFSVNKTNKI